jgi:uncharacterized protein GlcG (DUF336 family)
MATQGRKSAWVFLLSCSLFLALALFGSYGRSYATSSEAPKIDRERTILKIGKKQLFIVGENFEQGMSLQVSSRRGPITAGQIVIENANTMVMNNVSKADFPDGVATITIRNANGVETKETLAIIPSAIGPSPLTEDDIRQIIGQGIAACQKLGVAGTFSVLDREGNILALYQMKGAAKSVQVKDVGTEGQGLEGLGGPNIFPGQVASEIAAISKAGTGAFLSSFGNAFTTRTAAFIIRENIPPFIKNLPSGPLFGVQVSSLGCSDVKVPGLPLGMSGDTGGVPIYKNGFPSGGLGVEINGFYNVALNRPQDFGRPLTDKDELYFREGLEEIVAFASVRGFDPNPEITSDKILVNGLRLAYRRNFEVPKVDAVRLESAGKLLAIPPLSKNPADARIRTGVPSEFRDIMLRDRPVRVVNRFFPFKAGQFLSTADVEQVLFQGVREANRVRAAIRRPIEVAAEVNLTCIDLSGRILGIVSTPDAPMFGFDVSAEKARSAVFFSRTDTDRMLNAAGLNKYTDLLLKDGLRFDGKFMMTSRSVGFIHRPFFPDGINDTDGDLPVKEGPLSTPIKDFSPLNNGFQTDYLLQGRNGMDPFVITNKKGKRFDLSFVIGRSIVNVSAGLRGTPQTFFCDATNGRAESLLNNTLMVFTGSSLLQKDGNLAGAIGISGDGIDQDDIIGSFGSENFEIAPDKRIDRFFMRGIRIPYTKFPRHPHLGEESDD